MTDDEIARLKKRVKRLEEAFIQLPAQTTTDKVIYGRELSDLVEAMKGEND